MNIPRRSLVDHWGELRFDTHGLDKFFLLETLRSTLPRKDLPNFGVFDAKCRGGCESEELMAHAWDKSTGFI